MSNAKIRIAQLLKTVGLYPRSEVQKLQQQLELTRARLKERNGQLHSRNEQLQSRNEQLQSRNEQLQERNLQLSGGASRKYQTDEDEPIWHRRVIGGRWEEVGRLQLDFLRECDLQPQHFLLDVGCGSLRGGVRLVPYLEPGHYYGVDKNQQLLDAGLNELEAAGLENQSPHLTQMQDFGFERLGQTFDFALANSVFTHMPLNSIVRCLINMDRVLRPDGVFYATFFENREGKHYIEPLEQGDGFFSFYDRDPYHYTREALEWACEGTGLAAEYVGDWGHPRHQMMMAFRKETPDP